MVQIELIALGHRLKGESRTFWVDAKGNDRFELKELLDNFWLAEKPENADGEAISVRFTGSAA